MQQIIFGIFAHPDDETLVAGTLMKKSADGAEINLVVVTDGQAGSNLIKASNLGQTRLDEWQHSAEIISVKSTHALHYEDGQLNSHLQSHIESDIKDLVIAHLATTSTEVELSFITFDTDGLTGHSDHRLVTNAVMHVWNELIPYLPPDVHLGKLLCCRLSNEQAAAGPTTVEFPLVGYPTDEMDEIMDVHEFVSRKKAVMSCHLTQASDMEKWKQLGDELLGIECFRVIDPSTDQES